jgi:ankyrin repeat protein
MLIKSIIKEKYRMRSQSTNNHSEIYDQELGGFDLLPLELILKIFTQLSLQDLAHCKLVTHAFQDLMNQISNDVAKENMRRYFPTYYATTLHSNTNIDWMAELKFAVEKDWREISAEKRLKLTSLVEHGVDSDLTFSDLIDISDDGTTIIDWLIHHGHQQRVDDIFMRIILPKLQNDGRLDDKDMSHYYHSKVHNKDWQLSSFGWAAKCNQLDFIRDAISKEKEDLEKNRENKATLIGELCDDDNTDADTIIDCAAKSQNLDMLVLLLQHIKSTFENNLSEVSRLPFWYERSVYRGYGALQKTAQRGDTEITLALLTFFVQCDPFFIVNCSQEKTPLEILSIAAAHGHLDIIKGVIDLTRHLYPENCEVIIRRWLISGVYDSTLFTWAAYFNQKAVLDYLFTIDTLSGSKSLVYIAENLDVVGQKLFLRYFKDLYQPAADDKQETQNNAIAMMTLLIARGADVNMKTMAHGRVNKSALHFAVESQAVEVINFLLQQPGIIINAVDSDGKTALHYARDANVIEILLAHGAQINATDNMGRTALHRVVENYARYTNIELRRSSDEPNKEALISAHEAKIVNSVKSLLAAGANITATDHEGRTVLHTALLNYTTTTDKQEMVRILLDAGVDINATDNEGKTVLHYLAILQPLYETTNYDINRYLIIKKRSEMVDLLLAKGANADLVDKEGRTALMYAKSWEASYFAKEITRTIEKYVKAPVATLPNYQGDRFFAANHRPDASTLTTDFLDKDSDLSAVKPLSQQRLQYKQSYPSQKESSEEKLSDTELKSYCRIS